LKHEEFLKSLGATHVVDRTKTAASLHDEIKKIASAPIKHVYDAISSQETQQFGHDLLVPGGQLHIVSQQKITKADDKTILYVMGIRSIPEHHELLEVMYNKLTGFLEEGVFVVCSVLLRINDFR
jgi:NADPH:quinone reductase-like Zn-dependent oxidoreductase